MSVLSYKNVENGENFEHSMCSGLLLLVNLPKIISKFKTKVTNEFFIYSVMWNLEAQLKDL